MTATHAIVLLGAYFLGSIPFGVLIAKSYGVDIRTVGSGNTGATNVWRALGPKAGAPAFLLDTLKGLIPALVARYLGWSQEWVFVAGVAAIIGHCLSPFLGFKGGKGVATALGTMLGTSPIVALCAFGVFFLMMGLTRIVSLSALIATPSAILFGILFGDRPAVLWAYVLLTIFITYRHRSNIRRLLKGEEPKFDWRKKREREQNEVKEDDSGGQMDAVRVVP